MVDRIAQKNKELGFDIKRDFPKLFWILRDFTLDLESNSAQEYLDKCLEDVPTDKINSEKDLADVKAKNKLRKQIKSCFKNRTCLAFGRPAADENVLKNIENDDQIRPEFKNDVDDLMKLLTISLVPKSANKSFLSGSVFFQFLEVLINELNSGETPMLSSAVERLLASESEEKTRKIFSSCTIALDTLRDRLPMAPSELAKKASDTVLDYQELLREGIGFIASKDVYAKQSKAFLKKTKEKVLELEAYNRTLIQEKTSNLIQSFEHALPPTAGIGGLELNDLAATLRPLYDTNFGSTASSETLDWRRITSFVTESVFAQFEAGAARATAQAANTVANIESNLQAANDANRRLKATIAELETGLDELRRGREIDRERAEDQVADAKDVEIKLLREKLSRLETRIEKEKESQLDYKKKITDLEGAIISNEDAITAKDSELQSLITKVKENERILEAYSKKVSGMQFEVTEENSSALFELIKRLAQSVELLNIEMRAKNQTRITILQRRLEERDKEINELLDDRAQAYRSIREEYNKKLAELTATNKKAFESLQKKRDEMAEQMRVYQAEIQEKRLQEIETKKLKQAQASQEERIVRLTKQVDELLESRELYESSILEMVSAREKVQNLTTREIDSLIECVTGVTKMVQKGEKVTLTYLRDRLRDETFKKLKPFLDLNKVKV